MKLFLLGLPHTQFDLRFMWCAYTAKAWRFRDMMESLDYEVMSMQGDGKGTPDNIPEFDSNSEEWIRFNEFCVRILKEQADPAEDILCVSAGLAQQPVIQESGMFAVEYGVGYGGVCTPFRVFESYAWMHTVYGALSGGNAHNIDGHFYDTVIPNSFDDWEFPNLGAGDGGYLLFLGRGIDRKGIHVARQVAEAAGMELREYGSGTAGGVVDPDTRRELYEGAVATIVPTLYIEPFGGVHVESQLCGTPVITTDWGVFTETVQNGVNGYRCREFGEFVWAARHAAQLDRENIRAQAKSKWSTEVVRHQYDAYFKKLVDLRQGNGWYSDEKPVGAVVA